MKYVFLVALFAAPATAVLHVKNNTQVAAAADTKGTSTQSNATKVKGPPAVIFRGGQNAESKFSTPCGVCVKVGFEKYYSDMQVCNAGMVEVFQGANQDCTAPGTTLPGNVLGCKDHKPPFTIGSLKHVGCLERVRMRDTSCL